MQEDNIELVNKLGVIASTLSSITDMETLANSIHQIVDTIVEVEFTGLYFVSKNKDSLELIEAKGFNTNEKKLAEKTAMSRHPGWVFKHQELLLISDTQKDQKGQSKDSQRSFVVRSRIWLPILIGKQSVGAFGLASIRPNQFLEEHIALLSFICDLAAVVYTNIQLKITQVTKTLYLKEAGEAFVKLFESNPEAIVLHNRQYITHANQAFVQLFGYTSNDAIIGKKSLLDFLPQSVHSRLSSLIQTPVLKKQQIPAVSMKTKDAVLFMAEIHSSSLFINNIEYSIFSIRDITLKLAAEKKLKQEEQKSLLLKQAEQVPGIIYQLKYSNSHLSYPFIGGKLLDRLRSTNQKKEVFLIENIHPDDKSRFFESLKESESSLKNCSIDYRLYDKNKKILWIRANSKPVKLANETIIWHGYATDITDEKSAKAALKDTETQISTIFNHAPDAIILMDNKGCIKRWNQKAVEIFGHSKEEVIGQYMYDILPPAEYRSMFKEAIQRIQKSKKSNILNTAHELYGEAKSGQRFPIVLAISRMQIKSTLYFICFINNISERKKTDRKIRQSLKEKNILLKEIHHRVKNNMQVIASLLSLQASFVEDETIRKYFMSSQYRIRSMGMIHEMLYQSENISLIRFKDYLHRLVSELVEAYKGQQQQTVEYTIDCPENSFNIDTAIPLGLILNELISNSLKHGIRQQQSGRLSIKLKALDFSNFQLDITDNGIGMHAQTKKKNALGLLLVQKLIIQLSGTVKQLPTSTGCHHRIIFQEV